MSHPLFDLTGRRALVTGSSQGLGFAMARGLGQAGAAVVLNGRDGAKLERAVGELRAAGVAAEAAVFDVTHGAAVEAGVAGIEQRLGPIHVLVNNAGIQKRAPLADFAEADWRAVIETNLTGVFLVAQAVARRMIARKAGKIINICSLMSEVGRPTIAPYTAAKGAVKLLTKGMCADWAPLGLQVNGIGPGYFATEMNRALIDDAAFNDWVVKRTPAGRWGQPEELAGAAIFLASAASDFVNGQVLYVDGGLLAVV